MIAGVDIGGTTTQVVLVELDGTILTRASESTPAAEGGERMMDVAALLIDRLLAERNATGLLVGIGVGAAGIIDSAEGTVLAASDSFAGWEGFSIRASLFRRFGVPVAVVNDVNAFLIGERTFGAVAGEENVVALTLGTGVGGAILLGGELYSGPTGAAGELGHTAGYSSDVCTCGRVGHLETRASGRSVARRYAELSGTAPLEAREIAVLARTGDSVAARVFTEAGTAVGQAIVSSCTLLDINSFLIGGGLANAGDILLPAIEAEIERNSPVAGQEITTRLASLGAWSVALGGVAAALSLLASVVPEVSGRLILEQRVGR